MSDLCLSSTNLSTRAINILARNGILQLSELEECSLDRLTAIKGMGKKTLDEIIAFKQNPTGGDEDNAYSEIRDNFFFNINLTPEELKELSNHRITEIDMPMRAFHYLTVVGCDTIEQLVELKKDDLDKIPNVGDKTLAMVKEATAQWLQSNGYCNDTLCAEEFNGNQKAKMDTIFGQLLTDDLRTALSYHDVSELNLPCRAKNTLSRNNVKTVDSLVDLTIYELSQMHGLGTGTINEIISRSRKWLTDNGYYVSENFETSDEEKAFFEKISMILDPFLTVRNRQLLEICRKEPLYNDLLGYISNNIITEDALAVLFKMNFIRKSMEMWLHRLAADTNGCLDAVPVEVYENAILKGIAEPYAKTVLSCINNSDIFDTKYDTVLIHRQSLADFIQGLEVETDSKAAVLKERLYGTSLQEIGDKYELTRERIRQVVAKQIQAAPLLFEDYYSDAFKKYLLGKDDFNILFPDAVPEAHQYLALRYKKGDLIPQYESGEEFCGVFSKQVRLGLTKIHCIKNLTRVNAVTHVLRYDCLELVDFEEFQKKYNKYIEWLGMPPEKYALNWRSLANRLRLQKNLVFEVDGKFRYLSYDANKLKELIDFKKYENSVISCDLIYRDYAEELEDFDIQNGYELFCCLKNCDADEKDPAKKLSQRYPFDIIFRRIPVVIIGTVTEEEQVVALLKELSPIGYMDFWTAYEERFGIKRDSALANLGNCATPYLVNGTYIIDVPMLDASDVEIVRNELNKKKFWFIDELETLWKQLCIHSSRDSLNAATLRSLGYLMFAAGYAYSNQYNSMRDYLYDEQICDGEVFKLAEQDQRLVHLSAFQSCLSKEESALRIFEIAPREYVKDKYLFEQCGVTREDVVEFQQQVKPLCQDVYFNAHSIWDEIKDWPFVKMVGSNEWLCNSIIHRIDGIVALPIASNFILSFSDDCLSIPFICKWITNKEGKMSINDITSRFNSVFGTTFNRYVIAEKLRSSGMWSQIITDEIDGYIDSLADNSNFDVDSLLDEEFF